MAEQNDTSTTVANNPEMAGVMERNIKELIKLRQNEEKEKSRDERIADKITGFTGSMSFVYIHLILFALYIAWNAGLTAIKPLDPSFTGLSTIASVEAIFLSTFVLIRQNRMNKLADKRANLDLQVSLLAEHEITQVLSLVSAIAHKLEMEEAKNPEFDELSREVTPEKVLETIEKHTLDSIKETGISIK
jgi:uncharacterized membrane protein